MFWNNITEITLPSFVNRIRNIHDVTFSPREIHKASTANIFYEDELHNLAVSWMYTSQRNMSDRCFFISLNFISCLITLNFHHTCFINYFYYCNVGVLYLVDNVYPGPYSRTIHKKQFYLLSNIFTVLHTVKKLQKTVLDNGYFSVNWSVPFGQYRGKLQLRDCFL